jgi:hypothetical protein
MGCLGKIIIDQRPKTKDILKMLDYGNTKTCQTYCRKLLTQGYVYVNNT